MDTPSIPPTALESPFPPDGEPTPGGAQRSLIPWWLLVLAPVLLAAVVYLQRPAPMAAKKLKELESGKLVTAPGISPEIGIAKLVIAYHNKQFFGVDLSGTLMQQLEPPQDVQGIPSPKLDLPQDRFRAAIVVGKLGDVSGARDRMTALKSQVDPESPLLKDIGTATSELEGTPVKAADRDALIDRHGWFGKLLFDDGQPGGVLDKAAGDGEQLMTTAIIAIAVGVTMLLAGVLAVVIVASMMLAGRIRPWPTPWRRAPGYPDSSRAWFETVTLFLAGFLALKLAIGATGYVAPGVKEEQLVWIGLIGQWLLVGVLFWPRVRGITSAQQRAEVGWHTGRGFFREIGAGVLSYLALIPFYFLMAMIVTIGMLIYYSETGQKQPPIDSKVVDLAGGTPAEVVMVFLLATIWAPLVEETIFRGALYRLVRGRAVVLVAALASAAVFAAMHVYLAPQLILVGTLGFGFALIREWRGSLLPSMTAHFLHNAIVFSFVASMVPLLK